MIAIIVGICIYLHCSWKFLRILFKIKIGSCFTLKYVSSKICLERIILFPIPVIFHLPLKNTQKFCQYTSPEIINAKDSLENLRLTAFHEYQWIWYSLLFLLMVALSLCKLDRSFVTFYSVCLVYFQLPCNHGFTINCIVIRSM